MYLIIVLSVKLIPGLGRLLETTPHEAVRNNIVCILCDWVVRYATAIDPVMPQVTACLRDPTPIVRKQTLVLLIHLLQEDYLKIRGTFFFRILQLACDDDEGLRELALFYVTQRLLHRQPTIIQQHFIECVFHFNDYKGHPTYNKFALTDRESKLFSVAGLYLPILNRVCCVCIKTLIVICLLRTTIRWASVPNIPIHAPKSRR